MTVIAAVIDLKTNRGAIASDRLVTRGYLEQEGPPKVIRLGAALVGFTGASLFRTYFRSAAPLVEPAGGLSFDAVESWVYDLAEGGRQWAEGRSHGANEGRDRLHNTSALVLTSVGLWFIGPDWNVEQIPSGAYAIGSGDETAQGVLWVTDPTRFPSAPGAADPSVRVRAACEAACDLVRGCGGTVDVFTVPESK